MFGIPIPTGVPWVKIIACVLIAAIASTFGYKAGHSIGYRSGKTDGATEERGVWKAKVDAQRAEANALLTTINAQNDDLKRQYSALQTQWKVDHDLAATKIDRMRVSNAALAKQLGGLRDPYARRGPSCSGTAAAGKADTGVVADVPTERSGLLSAEASSFLLEFAADADRDAQVAAECTAAIKLR